MSVAVRLGGAGVHPGPPAQCSPPVYDHCDAGGTHCRLSLIPRLSVCADMATDPFHAVQREVQTSLHAAETLRASYRRIRSTARDDSEELIWARNEVCRALQ
jgi:hypothetical protein